MCIAVLLVCISVQQCTLSSGSQKKALGPLGLLLAITLVLRAQPSSSERTPSPVNH